MATFHLTGDWQKVVDVSQAQTAWFKVQGFGDSAIMTSIASPAADEIGIQLTDTFRPTLLLGSSINGSAGQLNLWAKAIGPVPATARATLVVMAANNPV